MEQIDGFAAQLLSLQEQLAGRREVDLEQMASLE
jgi:hypothetical protein